MSGDFTAKMDMLDLLIGTLREHEKALDFKVDALDGVIADLKQQIGKTEEILKTHSKDE